MFIVFQVEHRVQIWTRPKEDVSGAVSAVFNYQWRKPEAIGLKLYDELKKLPYK